MIKQLLITEATDNAMTTSQLLARYDALCSRHNVCDNCTHFRQHLAVCGGVLGNQHVPEGFGCNSFMRLGVDISDE